MPLTARDLMVAFDTGVQHAPLDEEDALRACDRAGLAAVLGVLSQWARKEASVTPPHGMAQARRAYLQMADQLDALRSALTEEPQG